MAENNVILQVQDVTMQFGGLRAIDNVRDRKSVV